MKAQMRVDSGHSSQWMSDAGLRPIHQSEAPYCLRSDSGPYESNHLSLGRLFDALHPNTLSTIRASLERRGQPAWKQVVVAFA